jgi:hypothetical protein
MQKSSEHFYDAKAAGIKAGWIITGVLLIIGGIIAGIVTMYLIGNTYPHPFYFAPAAGLVVAGGTLIGTKGSG